MATYVLIPGAGSDSWYWHLVAPELRARGHDVVTPDLPCEDDSARLPEYADTVVQAVGDRSGHAQARRQQAERDGRPIDGDFDVKETFFHDVPSEVVAEAFARGELGQSDTPFQKPWPLDAWPHVPTRFLLCRDDRFFPAEFLRRVVEERLGIAPDEMEGGHLPALSHPKTLADRLEAYRTGR